MISVAMAAVVIALVVTGFALGWKSRGKHEVERRGGDFLDRSRW